MENSKITINDMIINCGDGNKRSIDHIKEMKDEILNKVATQGAALIQRLKVHSSGEFAGLLTEIFDEKLIPYTYRSTPRRALKKNIFTATEYPASEIIPMHNEKSYSNYWPDLIGFFCMVPAQVGGQTPICNSHQVYLDIPKQIRDKFEAKGVMYIRNYGDIDLPWQEVFQTSDKQEVEQYCKENNISFEWRRGDRLRTTQINQASIQHPENKKMVWFNQAHLFHVSALPSEIRNSMLMSYGLENMPRHACYGDGEEISEQDLAAIRHAYAKNKIVFPWTKNDVLILDNILYAHGRESFEGNRKVLVGMATRKQI